MDKVRRPPHDRVHKHLNDGAEPAEVLEHILGWHLKGAMFLKADIIGIFERHGFSREFAEHMFSLLAEKGELQPVGQGFWKYEPKGGGGDVRTR